MTLSGSGTTLGFNQIRIELGIASQAPFSLTSASKGLYVTLNANSSFKPDGTDPQQVSEWYNYNNNPSCIQTGACSNNWSCCSNNCVAGTCAN